MPIAAGAIGDLGVAAGVVGAALNMAAERRRAAVHDRRHHLELAKADMAAVGFTPCGAVVAENIRDLKPCTRHLPLRRRRIVLKQQVERALDLRDQPDRHAGVARRRI
jgi:hypothetical protein